MSIFLRYSRSTQSRTVISLESGRIFCNYTETNKPVISNLLSRAACTTILIKKLFFFKIDVFFLFQPFLAKVTPLSQTQHYLKQLADSLELI